MSAFQSIKNFVTAVMKLLITVLPDSPFNKFISALASNDFLKYLNWFIPVGNMIAIGEAWLTCIAIYYVYQLILRWVKAIE